MPVLRPLDLVCIASAKKRDTLVNIQETGEFVINMAGTDLADYSYVFIGDGADGRGVVEMAVAIPTSGSISRNSETG